MKQKMNRPSGGKLRGFFCLGLAVVLAAGIALNSVAANTESVQYDISVKSSPTHTVALSGGDLYAWGTNEQGQFPGSALTESLEPIRLQRSIADVAVSSNRTLTVTTSGSLYSYGVEPATDKASPKNGTLVAKDAVQAAASETFAAYVSKTGALYTWGLNTYGQLGNGGTEPSETPVQILESGVKKVSLGDSFGLALMDDGTVYGWGSNDTMQLGFEPENGQAEPVLSPMKIADNMQDISAGYYHSCLLANDGSLWTCGDNQFSQAGVGGQYVVSGLTKILDGVRSVSAGSAHSFAISTSGAVYAWGFGVFGQLGSGDSQRIDTPTEINSDYVQVFAGVDNAFGVSSDGSIYSFGSNSHYRLGKTDGTNSLTAMRILDKDMNWVYEESLNGDDGHHHGAENPEGTVQTPESSELPAESGDPEIVSTPFVSGYDDGTFMPGKNVTRAEFLRMLVSALCSDFDPDKDYGTCSFSDVPLGKWYENYVAYAEGAGLVRGYSDGTFRPDTPITRAEACVMVSQMFDGIPEEAPDAGFTDLDPNSAATAHINYLAASGIVNGDGNGTFRPKANITRAESVTLVAAAVGYKPGADEIEGLAEQFPESPFKDVPTSTWYYAYMLRAVGYVE